MFTAWLFPSETLLQTSLCSVPTNHGQSPQSEIHSKLLPIHSLVHSTPGGNETGQAAGLARPGQDWEYEASNPGVTILSVASSPCGDYMARAVLGWRPDYPQGFFGAGQLQSLSTPHYGWTAARGPCRPQETQLADSEGSALFPPEQKGTQGEELPSTNTKLTNLQGHSQQIPKAPEAEAQALLSTPAWGHCLPLQLHGNKPPSGAPHASPATPSNSVSGPQLRDSCSTSQDTDGFGPPGMSSLHLFSWE